MFFWRSFLSDKGNPEIAVVVTKAYDLNLWLFPKVEKLPKSYRFSLGQRMIDSSLELLLSLVEAAYRSDKGASLRNASARTNGLRYMLRLAKDLHVITLDAYGFASERAHGRGRRAISSSGRRSRRGAVHASNTNSPGLAVAGNGEPRPGRFAGPLYC